MKLLNWVCSTLHTRQKSCKGTDFWPIFNMVLDLPPSSPPGSRLQSPDHQSGRVVHYCICIMNNRIECMCMQCTWCTKSTRCQTAITDAGMAIIIIGRHDNDMLWCCQVLTPADDTDVVGRPNAKHHFWRYFRPKRCPELKRLTWTKYISRWRCISCNTTDRKISDLYEILSFS
jgi:hypothetical protein